MKPFAKAIVVALKAVLGFAAIFLAVNVPSYFSGISKSQLLSANNSLNRQTLAEFYLGTAKPSLAIDLLKYDNSPSAKALKTASETMLNEKGVWRVAGGEETFFSALYSTFSLKDETPQSVYALLATPQIRNAFFDFLSQSEMPLVCEILKLRSLNTVLLPAASTSAGVPYSAAVAITALSVQSGSFNAEFLKDFALKLSNIKNDDTSRFRYESYCVGVLSFAKRLNWIELCELNSKIDSMAGYADLAVAFKNAPDAKSFDLAYSAVLMCKDIKGVCKYLSDGKKNAFGDFIYAGDLGAGALELLLKNNKPIHKMPKCLQALDIWQIENSVQMGAFCAEFPAISKLLKFALALFGSYVIVSSVRGLFANKTQNGALFVWRNLFAAGIAAILVILAVEPAVFDISFGAEKSPEIKFAFSNIINSNKVKSVMDFKLDMPTIVSVSVFLLLQFTIFVMSLIKIAAVKKLNAPASLKIELLNNEENLFDLGLYVGLAGTVLSLIMLSLNWVDAGLMAGYTSTLFGIMFTAVLKISFVRPYKRTLLVQAATQTQNK